MIVSAAGFCAKRDPAPSSREAKTAKVLFNNLESEICNLSLPPLQFCPQHVEEATLWQVDELHDVLRLPADDAVTLPQRSTLLAVHGEISLFLRLLHLDHDLGTVRHEQRTVRERVRRNRR